MKVRNNELMYTSSDMKDIIQKEIKSITALSLENIFETPLSILHTSKFMILSKHILNLGQTNL